jgi:hypothetical protein
VSELEEKLNADSVVAHQKLHKLTAEGRTDAALDEECRRLVAEERRVRQQRNKIISGESQGASAGCLIEFDHAATLMPDVSRLHADSGQSASYSHCLGHVWAASAITTEHQHQAAVLKPARVCSVHAVLPAGQPCALGVLEAPSQASMMYAPPIA